MDDTSCRLFFLEPTSEGQRLYEALRAVFVEGRRQKDVAERFGYDDAAFRQQVHQFRTACADGQPPPFLPPDRVADHQESRSDRQGGPNDPPSPTAAP